MTLSKTIQWACLGTILDIFTDVRDNRRICTTLSPLKYLWRSLTMKQELHPNISTLARWGPFYFNGLTGTRAWVRNHIQPIVWNALTQPCNNFNSGSRKSLLTRYGWIVTSHCFRCRFSSNQIQIQKAFIQENTQTYVDQSWDRNPWGFICLIMLITQQRDPCSFCSQSYKRYFISMRWHGLLISFVVEERERSFEWDSLMAADDLAIGYRTWGSMMLPAVFSGYSYCWPWLFLEWMNTCRLTMPTFGW